MTYYIKQQAISLRDRFTIRDETDQDRFFVVGRVLSWGKQLTMTDAADAEVAFIKQRVISFLPRFEVYRGDRLIITVAKEFSLFRKRFRVDGAGWKIQGDLLSHEYSITVDHNALVATVSKHWFTWGDSYQVEIAPGIDEVLVLATVIAIDAAAALESARVGNRSVGT